MNHSVSQFESRRGEYSTLHLLEVGVPPDHSLGALHAVEVAPAAVGVGAHSGKAEPVAHLQRGRHAHCLGDHVHSVAGHPEKGGVLGLAKLGASSVLERSVELVLAVFERDSVHDVAVEAMVKGLVKMVAGLATLNTFSEYSRQEIK